MTVTSITPETLTTDYLDPKVCEFYEYNGCFLGMRLNGEEHNRVILTRALPLNDPDNYVCVTDVERKELGIIEHIADFSAEQQSLIRKELSQRYFCPDITSITAIKEKMGHFYFDVKVGDYPMSFTIRDLVKNIRCTEGHVILTDVDGNRFLISDLERIDKKSRRKLEPYLY
ncbi:MAG: DUF1854 domain-containing protein [Clostridia bacterium]|nr:DUF1854 domain-containing protein [Clostridia bacterium]